MIFFEEIGKSQCYILFLQLDYTTSTTLNFTTCTFNPSLSLKRYKVSLTVSVNGVAYASRDKYTAQRCSRYLKSDGSYRISAQNSIHENLEMLGVMFSNGGTFQSDELVTKILLSG